MRRSLLLTAVSAVSLATSTMCARSSPLNTFLQISHFRSSEHLQTQCRYLHISAPFSTTQLCRFDLRQHEMEKRKKREMEKAGIDPNDEDDGPWVAPEEQQRLDEEEEQRRAELEEQRKVFLQKRAEEDAIKRQKFREFRAKQISMSRQRKMEVAGKKEEARQHREEQHQRFVSEDGTATMSTEGDEEKSTEAKFNEASAGGSPIVGTK